MLPKKAKNAKMNGGGAGFWVLWGFRGVCEEGGVGDLKSLNQ